MLEKPDIQDEKIAAFLLLSYELQASQVAFLPIGADVNTAVYRVEAENGKTYFLKLRHGAFQEIAVELPKFLHDQGVPQIIPPLSARSGSLWASLDEYKSILYPYMEGRNGYEVIMTDRHWGDFGAALKLIHNVVLPPALSTRIKHETYSPQWRMMVIQSIERAGETAFTDPIAYELAAFLQVKREVVLELVLRTEQLAQVIQAHPPKLVLCHADIHAGNILIGVDDAFYIVDWDDPILAPKERDLMYVGGAQGFRGHTPTEEEKLFYEAYGQVRIHAAALAYYRYERIIEDIAVECKQIFSSTEGGKDREQALRWLKSNFLPNNTIENAYQSDQSLAVGS